MASNVWPDPAERIAELEAKLAQRDAMITTLAVTLKCIDEMLRDGASSQAVAVIGQILSALKDKAG